MAARARGSVLEIIVNCFVLDGFDFGLEFGEGPQGGGEPEADGVIWNFATVFTSSRPFDYVRGRIRPLRTTCDEPSRGTVIDSGQVLNLSR